MNILLVSTEYPPAIFGGSAESVRLTAEALVTRGHRVGVVTPRWSDCPLSETVNGVAVGRFVSGTTWGSERATANTRFWHRAAAAIEIAAEGADLIHAQDRRMLVPAYVAARRTCRPAILTLRDVGLLCPIATCMVLERPGGPIPEDCGAGRLFDRCAPAYRYFYGFRDRGGFQADARLVGRYWALALERKLARRFDRIAYVSAGLARHYARAFPGEPTILHSPVSSVRPHECRRAEGPPIVLFVGKASLGKGYGDFVEAGLWIDAEHRRSNTTAPRFVHVGPLVRNPSPYLPRWIEPQRSLSPTEVEAWRCRASVCVVPSRQADALPRTALEAMAHGIPTVGTDAGGIPEALGPFGWLAPAGNAQALAESIRAALAHPWDQAQRDKVRQWTQERFGPDAVASAHERLYEEALS